MNGLTIPVPPESYWVTVPWWGYLAFFLILAVIVVLLGPWMIQRARGAPSAMVSGERLLAAGLEDLRGQQERARKKLEIDNERGWSLARGCLPLMHALHHYGENAAQKHNSLLRLVRRTGAALMDAETQGTTLNPGLKVLSVIINDRLAEYEDLAAPPTLPKDLESVEPKAPGETKYA